MSSIIKGAGDAVSSTIDAVTDNKEIIAAITAAYFLGPPATAELTAAELTAAETAAAETAAAETAAAQTAAAQTTAQNTAIQQSLYSTEAANALTNVQAANTAAIVPPSINANNPFQSAFFGDVPGISPATVAEGGVPVGNQGYLGVNGKFAPLEGSAADFGRSLIPQTPMEYAKAGLTTASGLNLYNAYKGTQQGTSDFERRMSANRNRTNDYSGPQAPSTYNSQSQIPLATRYNAARQQVSQTVGTPSSVGLLAVNNSPFYDFLNTNNINRGIL